MRRCGIRRLVLSPCAWVFGAASAARVGLYRRGWRRVHRAGCPVVSVGNLASGGTGKTPLVEWLAGRLAAAGRRPAILSRGYRGEIQPDGTIANDEHRVLRQNLPDVPHVQDPDRVRGAATAVSRFGCGVLVLDDGFQHVRLARDLDVVLLDALDPWGGGACLPAGTLREPPSALARAGVVVLSRADMVPGEARAAVRARVQTLAPGAIWAEAAMVPRDLLAPDGASSPVDRVPGAPVFAFCGIGNPDSFRRTLEGLGADVRGLRVFRDHHRYVEQDLLSLADGARRLGAARVLCTQKDLVKIPPDFPWPAPIAAVRLSVRIEGGEADLWKRVEAARPAK